MLPTLILSLALAQDPGAQGPTRDTIVLKEGAGTLEGKIVKETPDYVEIQLGPGTTVGFERSRIESLLRGLAGEGEEKGSEPAPSFARRDEWFVLHDGMGRVVGSLHSSVVPDGEGRTRIGEEWRFVGPTLHTEITELEVVGPDLRPLSCFYHERSARPGDDRIHDERVVRGVVEGDTLSITRRDPRTLDRRTYALQAGFRLPLELRETIRQMPGRVGSEVTCVLYDCRREELVQRTFRSGELRRVEVAGETVEVREITSGHGRRINAEWIDASRRVVRREVNGPALVAVPTTPELAKHYLTATEPVFRPALLAEAEGRFALWLPNPLWRFDEDQRAGQVTARAPLYGASVTMLILDHLEADLLVESAADAVERWLRLVNDTYALRGRLEVPVRGRRGVRLDGTYLVSGAERAVRHETIVYVFRSAEGNLMALCYSAPTAVHEDLLGDFERMVDSLELHAAGLREPPDTIAGLPAPSALHR